MSGKTGRSDVHTLRRFYPWQVWPGSYDNPFPADYPLTDAPRPRIDKATPIAGIGSCFLREMMTRLVARGYNFLREETDNPAAMHASAAWERLYNLFSVRQVLEYALTDKVPEPRWWITPQSAMVQDPYRRIVLYDDLDQAQNDFARHRLLARKALTEANVLLLTLDYVEVWEDTRTGAALCLPSGPYVIEGGDMSPYRLRVTGVEENLAALEDIRALLGRANPDCRLVLALSPIQQWVTFRQGTDVFSASFAGKAVLRAAAEAFVSRCGEATYFPAYEAAMLLRPALGLPVFAPGRENFHVDGATLDAIMREFVRFFDPDARDPEAPGPKASSSEAPGLKASGPDAREQDATGQTPDA